MTTHHHDPLVSSPRVKGRSIFTIIGFIVVGLIAVVVLYFAWIGWNSRGKPVPEVKVNTSLAEPRPAAPVAFVGGVTTRSAAA